MELVLIVLLLLLLLGFVPSVGAPRNIVGVLFTIVLVVLLFRLLT